MLEQHWLTIRDEALSLVDKQLGVFKFEDESLTSKGDWRQFLLYARGELKRYV